MTLIQLDIDPSKFQDDLKARIPNSVMQTLPELIINLIVEQFEKQLRNLVASGEILRFKIDFNPGPGRASKGIFQSQAYMRIGSPDSHLPSNRWPPQPSRIQPPWFLKNLPTQSVIELGWFEFTIVLKHNDSPGIHFERPVNLICSKPLEVKEKSLKTVSRYIVRMGYWEPVGLPVEVLTSIGDALVPSCQCHPDYLAAYIDSAWNWTIRFICKVCGKSYFCDCFRPALEKYYLKALEEKKHYAESGWPHKFIAAYRKSQFREGICHLCRDIPSELFYCHPMYGSNVKVHYGPYIKRIAIEKNIDEREAENEIRDILGIPHVGEGWVSERELLNIVNIVKDIFPENQIIHQSSPEWLGRQRLDIFIPELRLAIEYQGRQHYEPVPFFGGEEGFSRTQERDLWKARLCAENRVALVYFRYDESITRNLIETRIKKALSERHRTPV
jgi:hypothetical protein